MTIEKTANVDRIEVLESNVIQVREVTIYTDAGEEVSRSYSRYTLSPHSDLTGQPAKVADVARAAWGS